MSSLLTAKFFITNFEDSDISELENEYFLILKKYKKRISKKHRLGLNLILKNLLNTPKWIIFPLSNNFNYTYKNTKISGKIIRDLINILNQEKKIELKIGFKDKVQKATRIRSKIYKEETKVENSYSSIIMKDQNKKVIEKNHRLYSHNLRIINNHIKNIEIKNNQNLITFTPLYRVFNNNSFKFGGRFFGHFLTQSKKIERKNITMNNRKIVEVDFINFAINFLYQKENRVPRESYIIGNYLRKDVKKSLNTLINASSIDSAKKSIISETKIKDVDKFLEEIEKKHKYIKKYFYSGVGLRLQKIESRISEDVLLQCSKKNIPIFPLHDAFLTIRKHQKEVALMMISSYKNITQQEFIEVKIKNY